MKPRTKGRNAKAGSVCEYGAVDTFLHVLSDQGAGEVLLAPVYRSIGSSIQAGALVSGQRPNESPRVHTCVVLAVEAILVGERGRVIYPYRQTQQNPQVRTLVSTLQQELLTALQDALRHDARVTRLRYPASYQVPALQVWSLDALSGFPVSYRDGGWVAVTDEPGLPL